MTVGHFNQDVDHMVYFGCLMGMGGEALCGSRDP